MTSYKRLYRTTYKSPAGRHIAGVCGGLAEYLEIDPTLVRLAFVALMLMGGPGFVIYVIMWMVVPEEPEVRRKMKNDAYYDDVAREDIVRSEIPVPPADDDASL